MYIERNGNYARAVIKDSFINRCRKVCSFSLGRIVDFTKRIFKSKDRGLYSFNEKTGEFKILDQSDVTISINTQPISHSINQNTKESTSKENINEQNTQKLSCDTNAIDKTMQESTSRGNIEDQTIQEHKSDINSIDQNSAPSIPSIPNFPKGYSLHFGPEFALSEIMYKAGLDDVIRQTFPDKTDSDTFNVLTILSLLGIGSARQIEERYYNSILSVLYPNAKVKSQDISRFYAKFGSSVVETELLLNHINYLFSKCGLSKDFILDSAGVSYSSKYIFEIEDWDHEGDKGHGIRLGYLSHSIGMMIMPFIFSGNVHDVTTFGPVINKLKVLGINPERFRLDSAYMSAENIDRCYDTNNNCTCDFISRLKKNNSFTNKLIKDGVDFLKTPENIVIYNDRQLFIVRYDILAGTKNDKPAFLYVIFDHDLYNSELNKLTQQLIKGEITNEFFSEELKKSGVFSLISGKKYETNKILHEYLKRIGVESLIKFSKNDISVFPFRTYNNLTFYGKLYVGFYSLVVLRVLQFLLKKFDLDKESFFNKLSNQRALIYDNHILLEYVIPEVNSIFKEIGIILPGEIIINDDGSLQYDRAPKDDIPEWIEIANNEKSYRSKPLKTPVEKKNKKKNNSINKKSENDNKNNSNHEPTNASHEPRKLTPGRPLGSRNVKTEKREELVCTLAKILNKKCESQGISEEELKAKEDELAKQNAPCRGRTKGSKNKLTVCMEELQKQASQHIDRLANEFSMTRESVINLLLYQSPEPPTVQEHNGRGRRKGSFKPETLEKKAIQLLIESSLQLCQREAEDLDLTTNQLLSMASGITITTDKKNDATDAHSSIASKSPRGRRKGEKNALTLQKEAQREHAYRWLDEFCKKHSLSREEGIQRIWLRNKTAIIPELSNSSGSSRGRRKGSYGPKRIEKEVTEFIISSVLGPDELSNTSTVTCANY